MTIPQTIFNLADNLVAELNLLLVDPVGDIRSAQTFCHTGNSITVAVCVRDEYVILIPRIPACPSGSDIVAVCLS
jgi:hypothetical protein